MFIAPKLWIESKDFTIVFFFDIFIAPLDKLEERITGNRRGVIPIAIATANVNAVIGSCFHAVKIKTIGIIINMNFISNLLMLCTPCWKAVFGLPFVNVWAILPK